MSLPKKLSDEKLREVKDSRSRELTVRPLGSSRTLATTPIEKFVVAALKDQGPTSLGTLIERVARQIYLDEIRNGAWALDIGLHGSGLFIREVAEELKAGDGTLWEIKQVSANV